MFHPLNNNMNCLKRTSAIKVANMKIMADFHYKWKPSHAYHKIDTFFVVSKDEWDTKEGTSKSTLYAQWYGKRHLSG